MVKTIIAGTTKGDDRPASVRQYADHLKQRYLEEPILQDDPWPPSIGQHYINLALIEHDKRKHIQQSFQEDLLRGKIDQIQEEKETITAKGMFTKNGKQLPSFRMLMDGAPGVGKTTLCRKICQDWAKGDILQDCCLLVYVPLRDRRMATAQRIEDLFYHDNPDMLDSVTKHVRETQGAGTCFIFDGFDELSKRERERESLFLDIFKGKILRQSSVLVSSRPYASDRIQRMGAVTRHIEVLGFDELDIRECIETAIPEDQKASSLIEQLNSRQELLSLCYIPLNCAILIYVYTQEGYTVPITISELFDLFISNTLQRQTDIHGFSKKTLKQHVGTLSELAFNSLTEDKLAFDNEEVPEHEATLGLMTATKSFSSSGMAVTYQFIHLTIHEYLAAKWITSQFTEEGQAAFLQKHLLDDRFKMVLIFLSGITKLEGWALQNVLSMQRLQMYPTDSEEEHNKTVLKQFNFLIHLAYESQNPKSCSAVAASVEGKVLKYNKLGGTLRDEFEGNTMGYFIAQSGCTWEMIDLIIGIIPAIFFQHMETAQVSTSIKRFVVTYNGGLSQQTQIETLQTLYFTTPFKHLEYLDVQYDCADIESEEFEYDIDSIEYEQPTLRPMSDKFLSELHLKHLSLMFDRIIYVQYSITKHIISIVRNCKTLEYLELTTEFGYSNINGSNIANLLKEIEQSSIKQLRVGVNTFPHNFILHNKEQQQRILENVFKLNDSVEQLLLNKTDLHSLSLPSSQINETDDDSYRFSTEPELFFCDLPLKCNTILRSLNDSKLKHLYINFSLILSQTPRQLATMLSMNTMLESLILRIDTEDDMFVLDDLALGLKHNTTLRKLVVDLRPTYTSISDTNFAQLLFQTQSSLEVLVIKLNSCQNACWDYAPILILHNSVLSVVKIFARFTECQLKRIARCLVLNGKRRSIDLELGYEHQHARNANTIQEQVNEFKNTLFTAMIELMAHLLVIRRQRQNNFLQVHVCVKTTEFM